MLAWIRLTLWFSSYRKVLHRIERITPRAQPELSLALLTWAVQQSARAVPGATCLTQALALRYLAQYEGAGCTIRIGVKHSPGKAFEAHAWVVAQDEIILGGATERIADFKPIVDL